ncbi:MAG: hypothetical protein LH472_08100 [Pyrinomonadaceae bacterium]|nr:hypothetical protein [Pyrinomonadaceae bacterium]
MPKVVGENNLNSKYLQDIAQIAADGAPVSNDKIRQQTEKLQNALVSVKDGVVVVDRSNSNSYAVIENLAGRFNSDSAAQNLRGKKILKLDLGGIFADSVSAEQVSARLREALAQIEKSRGNAFLYVEDIAVFAKYNPLFGAVVADALRASLTTGKVRVISVSN